MIFCFQDDITQAPSGIKGTSIFQFYKVFDSNGKYMQKFMGWKHVSNTPIMGIACMHVRRRI